jgi:hypothetical protein
MVSMAATAPVAGGDLYIKDTPSDTGIEPNPDTGPMWVTEDIWVRITPDPGYQPYPFLESAPPWIPLLHENPEYRDPKYGVPNYVYVRVRNRGTSASTGTERLRLYFAKASTGLGWPAQWVDYVASNCGPSKLYGAEITKPRKNAALATAAERTAYVNAIIAVATNPAYAFSGVDYWHKQNEVHKLGPMSRHGTPAFLPWHRDFVNRYEALLQQADPLVKLLYWDWTTDPAPLFTSAFMGASGRGTGGVSIGAPFLPSLGAPAITRNLSTSTTPPAEADAAILAEPNYYYTNTGITSFGYRLENVPNHNSAHGYIGGGGNMSLIPTAAQDPFFFLLHGNVDRLWAQWQRDAANLSRLDPASTYDNTSLNTNITTPLAPWNGVGTPINPYTSAGGYIVSKLPSDASVVSPPIYDTAPLTIPPLAPGEAVVIQIPWFPPNPADFACFGSDHGHFCLLARIETAPSAPFGMTTSETSDVYANTRNNNNIAWKNVEVVDNFPGALKAASVIVRNIFAQPVFASLHFADTQEIGTSFSDFGTIDVLPEPKLALRWVEGGTKGRGIQILSNDTNRFARGHEPTNQFARVLEPDASMDNIRIDPGEAFRVDVRFTLKKNYALPRGTTPKWDLIQMGAPGNANAIVGGQRFNLDFTNLVLVPAGDQWRFLDDGSDPGPAWKSIQFDDSKWKVGRAELGYGDDPVTSIDPGHITTYFRRTFITDDPSFYRSLLVRLKRDDGAVVYLNGVEIHRVNLPPSSLPSTLATRTVTGIEEETFFPISLATQTLIRGSNVIAVELHQDSDRRDDASFDLELSANRSFATLAPSVRFDGPLSGGLAQAGQAVSVSVDALDPDGALQSVALFVDGAAIGTRAAPPFTFSWIGAPLGRHRLRVLATDNDQLQSLAEATVTVVANTPPAVQLLTPQDDASFAVGKPIAVQASASDPGGAVDRVEFRLHQGDLFATPDQVVGIAHVAPYAITLTGLTPDHYMLTAIAVDDKGMSSVSLPVMFDVHVATSRHRAVNH